MKSRGSKWSRHQIIAEFWADSPWLLRDEAALWCLVLVSHGGAAPPPPPPLNMTSGLFNRASPMAHCACDKPWRCWAVGIYTLRVWLVQYLQWWCDAVHRCHFTGADVCAACLQTSISLWWLFAPPPRKTLCLVRWCETIGFLLLGNVNPVLCPHGIQQWTLLRFEPCAKFRGLGKASVSVASAWIHKCKTIV